MSDFERGWKMYENGKDLYKNAKGFPRIVEKKKVLAVRMIIEGQKLMHGDVK